MKKFEKWLSFFWTFAWFLALALLCAYNVFSLYNNRILDIKSLVIVAISGAYVLYLIRPLIKKAKMLRDDDINEGTATVSLASAPYERKFLHLYERICNQRIACIVFLALLIEIPSFLLDFYMYSNHHPGEDWMIKNALYGFVPLIPCLVLIYKIVVAKKRNLKLLEQVYCTSNYDEIQMIDNIAKNNYTHLFTEKFFLNWDFNLNIVMLNKIESIRYVPYFYLFWYGTKLVIKEQSGRKHTIWFDGPESDDWGSLLPEKNNSEHAKVENNVFTP